MGLLIFIFGFMLALSFTILMVAMRPAAPSKSMQQRLTAVLRPTRSQIADIEPELEKIEQRDYAVRLGNFLQHYQFSKKIQVLLIHAHSEMSVGTAVMAGACVALSCGFVAFLLLHSAPITLVALVAGASLPYGILKFKCARRLKAFNTALPDAIDLMSRALRAGHSMSSSIELIAEQSPEPLAGEFVQVFQQQKFGIRFRDALLQMIDRIPSKDLQFLVTAILVQKETGGDLTEILDRTSYVIRDRVRIQGEVRTRTAQGRMTGWILGLLPIIMLALINILSPGYSSMLFHDPTGQKMLYAGGILIVIGGLVIRKVVDVDI